MGVNEYWLVYCNDKLIEQYILVNGKYQIKSSVAIIDEWELEKISPDKRDQYTTMLKPSIFDDLDIDIKDVFDFDF